MTSWDVRMPQGWPEPRAQPLAPASAPRMQSLTVKARVLESMWVREPHFPHLLHHPTHVG